MALPTQVAFADRILVNKTDLAEEAEITAIEKRLRSLNPQAPFHRCEHSKVDPMSLINIQAFSLDRVTEMDPEFLDTDAEHEHDSSVTSIAFKFDGVLNINKLQDLISDIITNYGANLYRYKGVLNVAGMEKKFVFQGVGMLFSGDFNGNWGDEKRECR